MATNFTVSDNALKMQDQGGSHLDGITLNPTEQEYLLPHFTMLLIGKPGSGKTTLLKQLLTNDQMYHHKFDEVLLVSPSFAKMGLKVKEENCTSKFSLDWIFDKIEQINEKQEKDIYGHSHGGRPQQQDRTSATGKTKLTNLNLLNDSQSRFYLGDMLMGRGMAQKKPAVDANKHKLGYKEIKNGQSLQQQRYYADDPDAADARKQQQKYKDVEEMDVKTREKSHKNVLIVLDDVVAAIKKCEFEPRLAQLFLNRRHVVLNGTVSIVVVSQKYTLIPSRIRSNANWLVLFQLNPNDFELVYRDAVIYEMPIWKALLEFVFGKQQAKAAEQDVADIEEMNQGTEGAPKSFMELAKAKKFDNIAIWVEYNVYFKNFKRIML